MIKYIKEEEFKDVIKEGTVLVDFYADWCGPCKMMNPVLEEVEAELKLNIVKVNIDEREDIAKEYGVMSIPTLILFENGEAKKQNVGYVPAPLLKDWVQEKDS